MDDMKQQSSLSVFLERKLCLPAMMAVSPYSGGQPVQNKLRDALQVSHLCGFIFSYEELSDHGTMMTLVLLGAEPCPGTKYADTHRHHYP